MKDQPARERDTRGLGSGGRNDDGDGDDDDDDINIYSFHEHFTKQNRNGFSRTAPATEAHTL